MGQIWVHSFVFTVSIDGSGMGSLFVFTVSINGSDMGSLVCVYCVNR